MCLQVIYLVKHADFSLDREDFLIDFAVILISQYLHISIKLVS